jgi:hypothetical protein
MTTPRPHLANETRRQAERIDRRRQRSFSLSQLRPIQKTRRISTGPSTTSERDDMHSATIKLRRALAEAGFE